MRKEAPLLTHLETKRAPVLVNGLRRAEGGRRANLRPFSEDRRTGGYQLSPLYDWSGDAIAGYISEHCLLVHPLHDASYPSIGCYPCTTPVAPGEEARAGRWRHLRTLNEPAPEYCGINFTDGSGI
jgi:phosphoadenosine phosphosulfate reductase